MPEQNVCDFLNRKEGMTFSCELWVVLLKARKVWNVPLDYVALLTAEAACGLLDKEGATEKGGYYILLYHFFVKERELCS